MEHRLYGRVVSFAGDYQNGFLTFFLSGVQKTGQRLQGLLARQAMEIKLMTDGNNSPFYLSEPVSGQRLQFTLIRDRIRKFCIQLQPANLFEKSALFDDKKLLSRFSGNFLQGMGTGLNRFFGGSLKRPHIRHRLQKQIHTAVSRFFRLFGGGLNRLSRYHLRNGDPFQSTKR